MAEESGVMALTYNQPQHSEGLLRTLGYPGLWRETLLIKTQKKAVGEHCPEAENVVVCSAASRRQQLLPACRQTRTFLAQDLGFYFYPQ